MRDFLSAAAHFDEMIAETEQQRTEMAKANRR